ncbi:hypothetical protein GLGCALEP_00405 [Pseudomonas sp. MM221]|nr:hypothetical protein GLGCALEP_00405 [Pseudomonas sp. MM221]
MQPLEQLEQIDQQIRDLLTGLPAPQGFGATTRQRLHGDLASFWSSANTDGITPRHRLQALRIAQLSAEVTLRLSDQTLTSDQAALLQTCLAHPLAAQRRALPLTQRPQLYRVLLEGMHPSWRSYLPGALIIVAGTAEGQMLTAQSETGTVLLCCLSQGIEAFGSLAELHLELCERLEDPLQSQPLLHLYALPEQAERARQATRLRYDWFADSLVEVQMDAAIEAQRQRLNAPALWNANPPGQPEQFAKALALAPDIGCRTLLKTRYSQLLEKNLPNWLRKASTQGLSHIMQTMQELVAASELAAAPGILDITAFRQKNSLLDWAKARLRERLRHDLAIEHAPEQILISIVRVRQTGGVMHPFASSAYVLTLGMSKVGDEMVELVKETQSLDQLALHNLPWFDADYWLTARVSHRDGHALPAALNPAYVKALVRDLNVGGSYKQFLQTQLIAPAVANGGCMHTRKSTVPACAPNSSRPAMPGTLVLIRSSTATTGHLPCWINHTMPCAHRPQATPLPPGK